MLLNDGELKVKGSAEMTADDLVGGPQQPRSRALIDTTGPSPRLRIQMSADERKSLAPFLLGQFSRGEFEITFVSERKLGVNEPVSGAGTVLPERPNLVFRRKLAAS
jgi:hypothetical protein